MNVNPRVKEKARGKCLAPYGNEDWKEKDDSSSWRVIMAKQKPFYAMVVDVGTHNVSVRRTGSRVRRSPSEETQPNLQLGNQIWEDNKVKMLYFN